jgi:integrase
VGKGIPLAKITAQDLGTYLSSRGGADDLSARYAWRLLRLVDRVLLRHARIKDLPPNRAAHELFQARPDLRFANDHRSDKLPDYLPADQAKKLVTFLSAVRPGRSEAGQAWQEVRDRSAVALMLGAGLAPGEVRALKLEHVVIDGGRVAGTPWKIIVPTDGLTPEHESPLAPWAGQLLRHWLDVRREQGIPGLMLFPATRNNGKPWGKVSQYNATSEVLQAAGLDDYQGGSYRLRHTFALRQLRRGKSADDVARWLGVCDPSVMARYRRVVQVPVDVY